MARMFTVGPFETDVGARVEQATRQTNPEPNWSLNMEICDLVNTRPDTAKHFLRAIQKRLQSTKATQHEVSLALVLLETASKNCGDRLRLLIAKKEFARDVLYKVCSPARGHKGAVPNKEMEELVLLILENIATEFEEAGLTYNPHGEPHRALGIFGGNGLKMARKPQKQQKTGPKRP